MKKLQVKKYRSLVIMALFLTVALFVVYTTDWKTPSVLPSEVSPDIEDNPASENHEGRWQYELGMLKDPATGKIPENIRKREMDYALNVLVNVPDQFVRGIAGAENTTQTNSGNNFQNYGPYNVGGRTRALALDVNDENIILAGGVSGGVWRSTDGGQSWNKTTSPRDFPSVSSIVQDRRSGHTTDWYFGGGELIGNSASASGAFYFGDGIYKSTDGGLSWSVIPATQQGDNVEIGRFSIVNEIAIDLSNTEATEIYVAGASNILRTTNDFTNTIAVLGQSNGGQNHTDVLVSPTGVVYATIANSDGNGEDGEEGVFMSTDGVSWTNINPPGLPSSYNRLELGLDPRNENILYLIGGSQAGSVIEDFLFRYNRATDTWTNLSGNMGSSRDIGAGHHFQGGYNLYVSVHPGESDVVFTGGTNLLRSDDAFASEASLDHIGGYQPDDDPRFFGVYENHHPDQHAAVYLPSNANVMITGNDGGLFRTDDNLANVSAANPVTWQSLNNGYVTSQLYAIDMMRDARGDMRIPVGMQDNGSWINYTNEPDGNWTKELAADGAFTAITHNSLYLSAQEGLVWRLILAANGDFIPQANIRPSSDDSEFLFINPFLVDPVHREKMFVAAQGKVYFTRDVTTNPGAGEWETITNNRLEFETVSALAASIEPEGVLYIGTRNGSLYKVNDTRSQDRADEITGDEMPLNATVSSIAVDPANADRVFVTFSNYNVVSIWMSENGGESWTSISGNMEQRSDGTGDGPSIRWIELLPDGTGENLYFIATSVGLFMTESLDGDNTVWVAQAENTIGRSVTNMIKVRPVDGQIAVSTHGNGVFVGEYEVQNSPTINYSIIDPRKEVLIRAPTSIVEGAGFSYEWLKDGQVIEGAVESTLTASESGIYKLRLTDESDNSVSESNELEFVLDAIDPFIDSSVRLDPSERDTELTEVVYRVTFNEIVNNVSIDDFGLEGSATGRLARLTVIEDRLVYDVVVNAIGGNGRLRLALSTDTDIVDAAGNALSQDFRVNQSYTVTDISAPSVSIRRLNPITSPTNSTEVSFEVRFSEAVSGVNTEDFQLSPTSIAGAIIESFSELQAGIYRIDVSGFTEDGIIDLDLNDNTGIEDLTGKAFSGEITLEEAFTIEDLRITSIDEKTARSVKVMNNPSQGHFRIIPGDGYAGTFELRVNDANGKQVLKQTISDYQTGSEVIVDLSNEPDGLFLMMITDEQGQRIVKLLKR